MVLGVPCLLRLRDMCNKRVLQIQSWICSLTLLLNRWRMLELVRRPFFSEEVCLTGSPAQAAEPDRPRWGSGSGPLFPSLRAPACAEPQERNDVEFSDAVVRLALLGFDPTKCHLALEAANGDENLARAFLVREA